MYWDNEKLTEEEEEEEACFVSTYEGEWRDNKMCGRGFAVFTNKDTYEGDWYDGEFHGHGIFTYHGGERDEGYWANGGLHGFGVGFYRGERKKDEAHGTGVSQKKKGYRVAGEWVLGGKHGAATVYFFSGSVWTGRFVNDRKEGPSIFVDANYGYTFEGNYCDDKRRDGEIRWLNGDSWIGLFSATTEKEIHYTESEGVMTFAETGNTLKGRWSDVSMKNGQGEMTMWIKAENREVKGELVDGRFRELPNNNERKATTTNQEQTTTTSS